MLRKIRPAETAHTVVATVDGELNEWTDTDLTAGDRRYKIAAVRDSLTSRRSQVAKLMLDEPPPLRPTPGTITQVPEKEPLTEKAQGDACTPVNSATVTVPEEKFLPDGQVWAQFTLDSGTEYQISTHGHPTRRGFCSCAIRPQRRLETRGKLRDRNVGQGCVAQLHAVGDGLALREDPRCRPFSTQAKLVRVSDLSNDVL